ncbi:MAG: hypothetical protein KIT84_07800 [Labilithrix sp.]|nr:hypothetical protein [Labilithrix sp.]MCW5810900.1 hypothetical protein [Labilithrix sp.]
MRNKLGVVLGSSFIFTALVIACAGHDPSDVLGAPAPIENASTSSGAAGSTSTGSTSTGGVSTSSTSTSTSSTTSTGGTPDACASCAAPPGCEVIPSSGCKCDYRCPDAGGPVTCEWGKDDTCPAGYYCDSASCGRGVCVQKAAVVTTARNPQCGCDGITYWNASIASNAGMSIRSSNACPADNAVRCGGLVPSTCPGGTSCNMQVRNKAECGGIGPSGACWKLPPSCGAPSTSNLRARPCGNGTPACADVCIAIQKQVQWYDDSCQ